MKGGLFGWVGSLVLLLSGCAPEPAAPLPTVASVDLARYAGTWCEIARYPNRFEKGCVGATATYTPSDGGLRVLNRCYDARGSLTATAEGRARRVGSGKFEVTFFWPFYGDYWILMLADDYRYSVVGDPARRYFWILSRTPELSAADRSEILERLPVLGYDPARLYWSRFGPAFR